MNDCFHPFFHNPVLSGCAVIQELPARRSSKLSSLIRRPLLSGRKTRSLQNYVCQLDWQAVPRRKET